MGCVLGWVCVPASCLRHLNDGSDECHRYPLHATHACTPRARSPLPPPTPPCPFTCPLLCYCQVRSTSSPAAAAGPAHSAQPVVSGVGSGTLVGQVHVPLAAIEKLVEECPGPLQLQLPLYSASSGYGGGAAARAGGGAATGEQELEETTGRWAMG